MIKTDSETSYRSINILRKFKLKSIGLKRRRSEEVKVKEKVMKNIGPTFFKHFAFAFAPEAKIINQFHIGTLLQL